MIGPIAQAIALTCHANAALRGLFSGKFWRTNSTAQFCESIEFFQLEPPWERPVEALLEETPDGWFHWLQRNGFTRARIRYDHERDGSARWQLAGMMKGAGQWSLETLHKDESEIRWLAWWRGHEGAPPERRWSVRYALATQEPPRPLPTTLDVARDELRAGIVAAHVLARRPNLSPFALNFERALRTLEPGGPHVGYHRDLAPDGLLDDTSAAVLDACQSAWVFGGQASWNDCVETDRESDEVSARLFHSIVQAIVVATNVGSAPR